MTVRITEALQLSDTTMQLRWVSDETPAAPVAGWTVARSVNAAAAVDLATALDGDSLVFVDGALTGLTFGDELDYTVEHNDTAAVSAPKRVTYVDLEVGCDPGTPDPLATGIRYAVLATVKKRLGITDATWDTELTQAIVVAEYAIDSHLGRTFPNECIPGIPVAVTQAAENVAIGVFKSTEAPFGSAGSDDFLGELDITEMVRREIGRTPALRGLRVSWGIA